MSRIPVDGLRPRLPSPLEELSDERLRDSDVRLLLKRDDLIHPEIPGNKWRKLKYNLEAAADQRQSVILTFGGAYSNNILATAAVGSLCGFQTIGVIRGEEHLPLNPTLSHAVEHGMRLAYLDRATYRRKTSPDVVAALRRRFGDFYLLPEGGSNALGVRGCSELPAEIDVAFDVICCAVGTGTTLAGIAAGLSSGQRALGFSVLKGGEFLNEEVARLQEAFGTPTANWSIETGYHFGGFARRTTALEAFAGDFRRRHGVALDSVYEAKMMYGLFDLVQADRFPRDATVVAVLAR